MTDQSLPNFNELDEALNKTSLKLHPSQVHGIICGILCGNPNNSSGWEKIITGSEDNDNSHEILQSVYQASAKELKEFLFDLQLLLPNDDEPLPERAEALTLWSQGFLTGLKLVQVPIVDREPSELTEAINDIVELAKMNYEEVVASEEDEIAYVELVEYVRMAVILIYQELREAEEPKANETSPNLH